MSADPLPNYVAAQLLLADEGHLYLVHSSETDAFADRICEALGITDPRRRTKIHVSNLLDGYQMYQEVSRHAEGLQDVHLNYTGGTKMMVASSYRAIREASQDASFSYLDKSLTLIIDHSTCTAERYSVGTSVHLSLETLLKMHGVTFDKERIGQNAKLPHLCQTLAQLHTTKQGVEAWYDWRRNRSNGWSNFPKGEPLLGEFEGTLRKICGAEPTRERVAEALGFDNLNKLINWFKGDWLEHFTLHNLKQVIASRKDVLDFGMNLHCQGDEYHFEFDVAAMRGYQLFAISCIASNQKSQCKEHLFEAYVRARQMGGDEARTALVCAYQSPARLLAEIEKPWDAQGKLRVFGARHLPNLEDHLHRWFDAWP